MENILKKKKDLEAYSLVNRPVWPVVSDKFIRGEDEYSGFVAESQPRLQKELMSFE